jgi:hypothetical protein
MIFGFSRAKSDLHKHLISAELIYDSTKSAHRPRQIEKHKVTKSAHRPRQIEKHKVSSSSPLNRKAQSQLIVPAESKSTTSAHRPPAESKSTKSAHRPR